MFNFDKTHDPRKNTNLLGKIFGEPLHFKEALRKTEQLFLQCRVNSNAALLTHEKSLLRTASFQQYIIDNLFHPHAKPSSILEPT
jgi:hypothetical protein